MKRIATLKTTTALMLTLGAASVYAQRAPVNGTFSGTAGASAINIQPGAATSEYNFSGDGTLGQFTFRTLSASTQPPGACPAAEHPYLGAGVFRFQDGSLLMVNLTQGSDCLQFTSTGAVAQCIRTFQITGGTGRFKNASGAITLTETVMPVLFESATNPVFFAVTGDLTGTISGVGTENSQNRQQ